MARKANPMAKALRTTVFRPKVQGDPRKDPRKTRKKLKAALKREPLFSYGADDVADAVRGPSAVYRHAAMIAAAPIQSVQWGNSRKNTQPKSALHNKAEYSNGTRLCTQARA